MVEVKDTPTTLFALGESYLLGADMPQSYSDALLWFGRAAAMGHVGAAFMLGQAYRFGQAVEKDMATARRHYLAAAVQGHGEAQITLGVLYDLGVGVIREPTIAHTFYSMARDAGRPETIDLLKELEHSMTTLQLSEARQFRTKIDAWMDVALTD